MLMDDHQMIFVSSDVISIWLVSGYVLCSALVTREC